jgi:hypothetical protein
LHSADDDGEREEAKADLNLAPEEEEEDEGEDEEGANDQQQTEAEMPTTLQDAVAEIMKLRGALQVAESAAAAAEAKLAAAEKKHEYEKAIEFAKRMEADEWCAKVSKDVERLKMELAAANNNKEGGTTGGIAVPLVPAVALAGESAGDDRLKRRASGSLEPMAEIAE